MALSRTSWRGAAWPVYLGSPSRRSAMTAIEPAIYLASLVHSVMRRRYCAAVVAAACQQIASGCQFQPSVSELVTACDDKQGDLRIAANILERLERLAVNARDILAQGNAQEDVPIFSTAASRAE